MSNRGDLTVDKRRRPAQRFKPRSFFAVPGRRSLVIWQDRKRRVHDVPKIRLESGAALAFRQPATTVDEFVPHGRRNSALGAVLVQTLED